MSFGPVSIWAPLGEVVLLVVGLAAIKASSRVTGRQTNMPAVPVAGHVS